MPLSATRQCRTLPGTLATVPLAEGGIKGQGQPATDTRPKRTHDEDDPRRGPTRFDSPAESKRRYAFLKQNIASSSTSVEWTGSSP
jgi:hypothetical protein